MKQKDNWEKEFDSYFLNPDRLSSRGQFKPELQGKLYQEFKKYVRTVRQQAVEENLDNFAKEIYEEGRRVRQETLAEALAAIPPDYGYGPYDEEWQREANRELARMNGILSNVRQKIQALMDGDDTENSVTIGIGEQKVKISIDEHHEEGSDKK